MIIKELRENKGETTLATREKLALEVFQKMAAYDAAIAHYLENRIIPSSFPNKLIRSYEKMQDCRYGENWDQRAAFYKDTPWIIQVAYNSCLAVPHNAWCSVN